MRRYLQKNLDRLVSETGKSEQELLVDHYYEFQKRFHKKKRTWRRSGATGTRLRSVDCFQRSWEREGASETRETLWATLVESLQTLVDLVVEERIAKIVAERDRPDEFMSVPRAAAYVDVTRKTIRRWMGAGKLVEHRAGRKLLVRRSDLDALLAGGSQGRELTPEQLADRGGVSRTGSASTGASGPRMTSWCPRTP